MSLKKKYIMKIFFLQKALCDAVIWAINNQKLIHEMGKKAEKSAKQEFSMTKHVKEIKKLYCEVLSNV